MGPRDVLVRMAEMYATLATYRDRGTCTLGGARTPTTVSFATAFARPDRLRLELGILGKRSVLRLDHGVVEHMEPIAGRGTAEAMPSLAIGIASMTGISFGAAHHVPRMLLPDHVTGRMLGEGANPVLQGIEEVEGALCHRIEFSRESTRRWIFIGVGDFLLHRVHEARGLPLRPMKDSTLAGFLGAAHTEAEAASMRDICERSQRSENLTVTVDYSPEANPDLEEAAFALV
jgi:hypothetical protein